MTEAQGEPLGGTGVVGAGVVGAGVAEAGSAVPSDRAGAGRIRPPTLASVVARHIEDEVVAAGWPVGTVLGSETQLQERYGVSRAVLREGVRIAEHSGIARMRPGPGGGLVVLRPDREALVAAVRGWCSYVGITMAETFEVRRPLVVAAAGLAAVRCRQAGAGAAAKLLAVAAALGVGARLRLEDLAAFESEMARLTTNRPLSLFADSLADLALTRLRQGWADVRPRFSDAELDAHASSYRDLARGIAAGQVATAEEAMTALLDVVQPRIVDLDDPPAPQPVGTGTGKLAEQVASALQDDIERAGWPVGSVLGSETELIERHGVSRAIFREAVRLLEHHGAVRTKRGPRGGLVVTAPDLDAFRRAAGLYLEYEGVRSADLADTRSIVEVGMVRIAAERITHTSALELRASLRGGSGGAVSPLDFLGFHQQLASVSRNRIHQLFVAVLADLLPGHAEVAQLPPGNVEAIARGVRRAHARIVDAVAAGDGDAASRRMHRHLHAASDLLR